MGRLIDSEPNLMSKEEIVNTLKTMVFGVQAFERFNAKEREALDKSWNLIDQYEARLKADMVAMLTELEKELKEEKCNYLATIHVDIAEEYFNLAKVEGLYLIQQKINELKAESEEQTDGNDNQKDNRNL